MEGANRIMSKKKTANHKIKRPKYLKKEINFYGDSFGQRIKQLDAVPEFEPTILSEFAAGYGEAIRNVRIYGLPRVSENALSGIPK